MQAQNEVRVTFRVDKDLKNCADALFGRLGMNMTTALNVFLHKAVSESAIPFPISVNNTAYANGCSSSGITGAFESAVQEEIAESRRKGFPVARYDQVSKRAFLENADGTREYVSK